MKFFFVLSLLLIAPSLYSKANTQEDTTTRIFQKVEKEAAYTGGEREWRRFLEKNLNPNVPVDHGAPVGLYKIIVEFVVNKDGNVSDIKPLTNLGYGMEQEVTRLLRKSGSWQPATQNGRAVNAYRRQPVTFMVTEDGFDISPNSIYADKDNEITIEIKKVKSDDLNVTISRGTITQNANGKFIIHVTGTDRVIIKVYNKKKNNKQLNTASLEVIKNEETIIK